MIVDGVAEPLPISRQFNKPELAPSAVLLLAVRVVVVGVGAKVARCDCGTKAACVQQDANRAAVYATNSDRWLMMNDGDDPLM